MAGPQARPAAGAQTSSYFGYQPELSPEELSLLRRQQVAAHAGEVEGDRQNTWMLAPVFAPELVVAGAGLGAAAKRLAALPAMRNLEGTLFKRSGDLWEARVGRRAHAAFKAKVSAKPGWTPEPTLQPNGKIIKPDALTPIRPSYPKRPFNVELKPSTPSGRRAGARQIKIYEAETGNRGRVVYYDPKDFR